MDLVLVTIALYNYYVYILHVWIYNDIAASSYFDIFSHGLLSFLQINIFYTKQKTDAKTTPTLVRSNIIKVLVQFWVNFS